MFCTEEKQKKKKKKKIHKKTPFENLMFSLISKKKVMFKDTKLKMY
jgi:hypothetical protein